MEHVILIHSGVFLGLFTVFFVFERMAPEVSLNRPFKARWITHFSITIIHAMLFRLMSVAFPFLAVGAAGLGWVFFNVLDWPLWIDALLSFLILDFTIWAQRDSDYGFSLSVWDRIFDAYRGETATPIVPGLKWQDERPTEFRWSLSLPFMLK